MKTRFIHNSKEYKGIIVHYTVDFQKKEISIVNQDRKVKNFVFQNRGLEYMAGWKNILDAIYKAMDEAIKLLSDYNEEEENEKIENVMSHAFPERVK